MDFVFDLFNPYSWLIIFLYIGLSVWISRVAKKRGSFLFLVTGGFTIYKIVKYIVIKREYPYSVFYLFVMHDISFPLYTLITVSGCLLSLISIVLFLLKRDTFVSVIIALFSNLILFLTSAIYANMTDTF